MGDLKDQRALEILAQGTRALAMDLGKELGYEPGLTAVAVGQNGIERAIVSNLSEEGIVTTLAMTVADKSSRLTRDELIELQGVMLEALQIISRQLAGKLCDPLDPTDNPLWDGRGKLPEA